VRGWKSVSQAGSAALVGVGVGVGVAMLAVATIGVSTGVEDGGGSSLLLPP